MLVRVQSRAPENLLSKFSGFLRAHYRGLREREASESKKPIHRPLERKLFSHHSDHQIYTFPHHSDHFIPIPPLEKFADCFSHRTPYT